MLGADIGVLPVGQKAGSALTSRRNLPLLLGAGFVIGFFITVAEPDVHVLAQQVSAVDPGLSRPLLVLMIAVGVGLFVAIALGRIILQVSLRLLLLLFYLLLFGCAALTSSAFLGVAFDAGGATTGPMTVPFIMALGVGVAAVRGGRGKDDSFGLIALCSVGPILMVMLLGIFYHPTETIYDAVQLAPVITTQDVALAFLQDLPHYTAEVLQSTLPIVGVFVLFQVLTRSFQPRQLVRMVLGFVYTIIGLILFLTGVNVGFAPVGNLLGSGLGRGPLRWALLPIGMLIGYYIVKAEPAVQVLNEQVEEITGGTISRHAMNRALQAGVAVAVALAMLRVLTGLSIYWVLIPGYAAALIMSRFVPPVFVGIAFDSGGVASGPMTSTFLLPLAMGACSAVGGNVVTDAFGIVALVALAPLIAIQIMGLLYARRTQAQTAPNILDDTVVELEEY